MRMGEMDILGLLFVVRTLTRKQGRKKLARTWQEGEEHWLLQIAMKQREAAK